LSELRIHVPNFDSSQCKLCTTVLHKVWIVMRPLLSLYCDVTHVI